MSKISRHIINIFALLMFIFVGWSFLKDRLAANEKSAGLKTLAQSEIKSIEIGIYQHGVYDQSGNPTGLSRLTLITNQSEIQLFKQLLVTNQSTRWNHFGVQDTFQLVVNTDKGKFTYNGIQTGLSSGLPDKNLWIRFSGNEGTYVSNLFSWIKNQHVNPNN